MDVMGGECKMWSFDRSGDELTGMPHIFFSAWLTSLDMTAALSKLNYENEKKTEGRCEEDEVAVVVWQEFM